MARRTPLGTSPREGHADAATELAARRTGMSFQRTRMSADRTLMSAIRTSFSLVSFGFTIEQVFRNLHEQHIVASAQTPRHFGQALIYLGVAMMSAGIIFHLQFMYGLRRLREEMKMEALIHAESRFPASYTLVIGVLVLIFGLGAIMSTRLSS
ncbi:MAG: YidH family protein [Gemmatimonadaceae bacterium]